MVGREYFTLCCTEARRGSAHYQAARELHRRLVPSLQAHEAEEEPCYHLVCFVGDDLSAYAQIEPIADGTFRLRCILVDAEKQGRGVGSCLLAFTEKFVKARRGRLLHAWARRSAISFFSHAGYEMEDTETVSDEPVTLCKQLA